VLGLPQAHVVADQRTLQQLPSEDEPVTFVWRWKATDKRLSAEKVLFSYIDIIALDGQDHFWSDISSVDVARAKEFLWNDLREIMGVFAAYKIMRAEATQS
jgi:hypothetical protein